jgi:AraC-like DNA-binding protein
VIKTILPASPVLKRYIECFYLYSGEANSNFRYWAFPHYNTGLSFINGASVRRRRFCVEISESSEQGVKIEILGKYTCPVMIEYTGKVQEISIVFKPAGVNRFFRENFQSLAPDFSQELVNDTWTNFGEVLFSRQDDLHLLESFLLSQFSDNAYYMPLEASLLILDDVDDESSISELALRLGYNIKTFQRYFKKHMGCSPVEYRRICRFRKSMETKLSDPQLKTLPDITYEGGYSDQSYFIKEFRKLTNHNPKDFFKVAGKIDGDKLVWEIK